VSRLYDRTLRSNSICTDRRAKNELKDMLSNIPVIVADNVTEYYFAHNTQETWNLNNDFPTIMPPFNMCFIETRPPSKIVSEKFGILDWPSENPLNWGILMIAEPALERHFCSFNIPKEKDVVPTDAKWIVAFYYIAEREKNRPKVAKLCSTIYLDNHGKYINDSIRHIVSENFKKMMGEEEVARAGNEMQGCLLFPVLLTVSFMHCKNVTMQSIEPPIKLSKKHQKKYGKPLVRYHVLEIEPMKKILRTEGRIEEIGLNKALHICRGHFKDYREGGGLFGKHKGLYWWDSHVRGNADKGVVLKDYQVNAGEGL